MWSALPVPVTRKTPLLNVAERNRQAAPEDGDPGAGAGEAACHLATEDAGAAGDDGDLAVEGVEVAEEVRTDGASHRRRPSRVLALRGAALGG